VRELKILKISQTSKYKLSFFVTLGALVGVNCVFSKWGNTAAPISLPNLDNNIFTAPQHTMDSEEFDNLETQQISRLGSLSLRGGGRGVSRSRAQSSENSAKASQKKKQGIQKKSEFNPLGKEKRTTFIPPAALALLSAARGKIAPALVACSKFVIVVRQTDPPPLSRMIPLKASAGRRYKIMTLLWMLLVAQWTIACALAMRLAARHSWTEPGKDSRAAEPQPVIMKVSREESPFRDCTVCSG
jgi:hypothetical protein